MQIKLSEVEIVQAIIEYLERRGITGVVPNQVTINFPACLGDPYNADVESVDPPPRKGSH